MSKRANSGKIRVLYVGGGPVQQEFTKLLSDGNPDLDLTTTNQPLEILNILPNGFDCLILDEKKPYIDGVKKAKIVRDGGFPYLPIIIQKKDQKTPKRDTEKVEASIFFDKLRDPESAQRLAEVIRSFGKNPSTRSELNKRGLPAPIGD